MYLRGWKEYFKLAETPGILADLDGWIHRRLRALQLEQWKRGRTDLNSLNRLSPPGSNCTKSSGKIAHCWCLAAE
jgi:hypothetical protein